MSDYQNVFQEIADVVEGLESLRKTAFQQYSILVDAVMKGRITDRNHIERIVDGLSDFGDYKEFLELYRKLCRYVYDSYPEMVGEHATLFRALFVRIDDSEEDANA